MTPALRFSLALLTAPLLLSGLFSSLAHAEGTPYDETEATTPKPKPAVKRRKPVAAKPAPVAVTTPDKPLPYNATLASADMAKGLTLKPGETTPPPPVITPIPADPLPPPVAIEPTPLATQPIAAPPPPLPARTSVPQPSQISLKCETQVTAGNHLISQGTFYIDLFPSPVFPDAQADFKFMFVDPAHQSLIRQSVCLDTNCSADVTGTAYALLNRVTRKGSALRITLDRSTGAFYAEEIDVKRVGGTAHRGEKGYCTPQKLPAPLF